MAVELLIFGIVCLFGATGGCLNTYVHYDGHCYHYSLEEESWTSAMSICKLYEGYLVEIDSETENNFIKILINGTTDTWIGGTDADVEGEWLWAASRKRLGYQHWRHDQPNNLKQHENCLEFETTGFWNDELCTRTSRYICEIPLSIPI